MTATILNFRPATVTPLHAAPREPEAKSYFFSGGSLHFNAGGRGIHLEPDQAMRLRLLYAQQAAEAYEAREIGVARRAAKLWGELGEALDGPGVQVALDQVIVRGDAPLNAGTEVAFLPPMSGG